ncbi:hypothetical protein SA3733_02750 [Aggregatibacter actinomycetemcomitans serotype d str. SA3733]|nr:hypothetical protein SA508_08635 [Aggregatibacter actinomycetemcomitans serotype d str. SA508]KYK90385.1 hypothetical protein SA269_11115 [Aggregatibacter actinomycetemcomitans serotype d str. SA269]KYK96284.1 hypothetical protein SA3733_02750 [Aggregatibacter actinomycetemcomitans serotype d str. SA3733]
MKKSTALLRPPGIKVRWIFMLFFNGIFVFNLCV